MIFMICWNCKNAMTPNVQTECVDGVEHKFFKCEHCVAITPIANESNFLRGYKVVIDQLSKYPVYLDHNKKIAYFRSHDLFIERAGKVEALILDYETLEVEKNMMDKEQQDQMQELRSKLEGIDAMLIEGCKISNVKRELKKAINLTFTKEMRIDSALSSLRKRLEDSPSFDVSTLTYGSHSEVTFTTIRKEPSS